jgi:hypothetical protein
MFAIPRNASPVSGGVGIPTGLDFTGSDVASGDLAVEQSTGIIGFVQSIWIDNSLNAKALSIVFPGTQQKITVKANTQGYYPVVPFQGTFTWQANSIGAAVIVPVIFMNERFEAAQWPTV